jgi:DNA-binding transcriptional ArsR family regulator
MTRVPDAAVLAGLLADEDRRKVLAALILGAQSMDQVVERSGLAAGAAGRALGRLVDAGLVVSRADGAGLHLLTAVFADAARTALARPAVTEHDGSPPEVAKVMRAFVREGRLLQIPTAPAKRAVVLDWLAQEFEPGKKYSEKMVNLVLGQRHADTAALRRYLVDGEYLDRADGWYWRAGGSVEVGPE